MTLHNNKKSMESIKYVIKRNGLKEPMNEDKIFYRIKKLIEDPKLPKIDNVSALVIAKEVQDSCIDGITTTELDNIAAKIAIEKRLTHHLNYGVLATRITISNLHKNTSETFSNVMESLYNNRDPQGNLVPIINDRLMNVVRKNKDLINSKLDYTRDYTLTDFFGIKTFEKSYLLKKYNSNGQLVIAERIQTLMMRVSLGIFYEDLDNAFKNYDLISQGFFTNATPTLFNAGTIRAQKSSCFLLDMEDSMEGIYKTITDIALISKYSGGIGYNMSNIRSKASYIAGTGGQSDGIVKPIRVVETTALFSNQGGGKRNGSVAIYLEPHHADIYDFLELKKNAGDEFSRARKLFYALWVSDLFMKRVEQNGDWYLMDPNVCKGLTKVYSGEYEKLYNSYVEQGKYIKKIKAQDLWKEICNSQIETGMPYISYKDAVNEKSNQKNMGTIVTSNLCNEINIYTTPEEYGTCNIATISLPKFVEEHNGTTIFNFQKLYEVTKFIVINMNNVIDYNYYPVPETKKSNLKGRPIALGNQGLALTFFKMRLPFESDLARELNKKIYETIQFASLESSCELAQKTEPYSCFDGSPASFGLFQHNLWGKSNNELSGMWDWDALKEKVIKHKLRNSLLSSQPPTASTSQLLGNSESMEPIHSNVFEREILAGSFTVINEFLIKDLMRLNLWNKKMYNKLLNHRGSIQNIPEIPDDIKELYKTVWEIKQRHLIQMSADRGVFIDQSQSLNLYVADATIAKLTSLHFFGWKSGLKTGMYYLRSQTKAKMQQFTVEEPEGGDEETEEPKVCYRDDPSCLACSG
jgi:ribonucleoside-diphosphate reductase alpha chain